MTSPSRHSPRSSVVALSLLLLLAVGCTGLLQNLGARWVTRQIAVEFNFDEAQTAATRASVDKLMAAAPAALGSKIDMLVATVDVAIAKGLTEEKLMRMERQVDGLIDTVAGAIIDEAAPIMATLRDDQIHFVEKRIEKRLEEAREELSEPSENRVEKRQDQFVDAVEDWAGSLTDGQEAALRSTWPTCRTKRPPDSRPMSGGSHGSAKLARTHPDAATIRDAMWEEWKNREDWGPNARPPSARRAEGRQALLFVYGLLDAGQRDHASKHLHELHDKVKSFFGAAGS